MGKLLRSDLRFPALWLGAAVVLLGAGFVVALRPAPYSPPSFSFSDKIAHAIAFMGFMVVFSGCFNRRYWPFVFAALLLYGGAIELAQMQIPSRSAETGDLLADAFGLGIGWVIADRWFGDWCVVTERWCRLQ